MRATYLNENSEDVQIRFFELVRREKPRDCRTMREWIHVIQAVEPWMSLKSRQGLRWSSEIAVQLEGTRFVIYSTPIILNRLGYYSKRVPC